MLTVGSCLTQKKKKWCYIKIYKRCSYGPQLHACWVKNWSEASHWSITKQDIVHEQKWVCVTVNCTKDPLNPQHLDWPRNSKTAWQLHKFAPAVECSNHQPIWELWEHTDILYIYLCSFYPESFSCFKSFVKDTCTKVNAENEMPIYSYATFVCVNSKRSIDNLI